MTTEYLQDRRKIFTTLLRSKELAYINSTNEDIDRLLNNHEYDALMEFFALIKSIAETVEKNN